MKKIKLSLFATLLATVILTSCKSDDGHSHGNDQELITTVRLTYTNTNNVSDFVVVNYRDFDGAGGANPIIDNIRLKANTTYTVKTEVLNESKNPIIDLTPEILTEATEHQFFYVATPPSMITITYTDKDSKGLPIGLNTSQIIGAAGTAALRVVLKHQPGLKSANSTINTGETDIEVIFPVTVQ